jgi:metal-sulfur cluster biosynthetic enzyme
VKKKVFFMVLSALGVWALSVSAQVITEKAVWDQLKELKDPQFLTLAGFSDSLSVVDLGLIYKVQVKNNDVKIIATTFHRGFVQTVHLGSPARKKILAMPGVKNVTVEFVWEPAWTPARLSKKAREVLRFEPGDPVEGKLHVRSTKKADADTKPVDERKLDRKPLVIPATAWSATNKLPGNLSQWSGWRYCKRFEIEEKDGLARKSEPIHMEVAFKEEQVRDLAREIRLIEETSGKEIPCQVYGEAKKENSRIGKIVFLADINANEKKGYLVLYGNSSRDIQAPSYKTDLITRGEGYALEIENSYYKINLSHVMGQLKTIEYKRWGKTWLGRTKSDPPKIIDASNDPEYPLLDLAWHGEDLCLHHNPDFVDQLRFRITMWSEVPNYSVVKGPICTIVKRWGYPVCPIYPALPQSAVMIEVTYVFYSGLPYFTMESHLNVEKEVDIKAVRNDEWLFTPFSTIVYKMEGKPLVDYQKDSIAFAENPSLIGFYSKTTGDGFASLHLGFDAIGFPGAYGPNSTSMTSAYNYGGQIWVRYPFNSNGPSIGIRPGATIGEYNAYLLYNAKDPGGNDQAGDWYNILRHPLKPQAY